MKEFWQSFIARFQTTHGKEEQLSASLCGSFDTSNFGKFSSNNCIFEENYTSLSAQNSSQIKAESLKTGYNKFYFTNFAVVATLFVSIIFMFFVQFKVEALQDEIAQIEVQIADYKDEIQLLEVEWVYLTRPARLRELSARYLQENNYALASQIKNEEQLEKYYLVNYQKSEEQEMAQVQSF